MLREVRRLRKAARRTDPGRTPPATHGKWCRTYLPHYFRDDTPPADFHPELFDRLDAFHRRRGSRLALVAPREGAKSTIINLSYALRAAVERWEPFIILLSDSSDQANEQLSHVRAELETNAVLAADYPGACGPGRVWRHDRLTLPNGVVVKALGRGKRVRGRRNRQSRPSLVIFDDVESNEDVLSPRKRERAWLWASREVIPAGDAGTNFLSVGSAIHPEAVAVKLGKLPGWDARTFQAVHRWPERLDLWAEWERLATNLADEDRKATARAFYDANRAEMDRGAEVYWPERWSLYDLMSRRAEVGTAAFDSEYQGIPNLGGLTVWPPELWDDAPDRPFWFDQWPDDLVYRAVSLDPSEGGINGDYQAWGMVGMRPDGDLYVDCEADRTHPTGMVKRTLDIARRWGAVNSVVVEQNSTMGLLKAEFEAQMDAGLMRVLPVEYLTQKDRKEDRILDAVGKYLTRRRIRVRRTRGGLLLAEQGRQFPHADHDDCLDATSMAIRRIEGAYSPNGGVG